MRDTSLTIREVPESSSTGEVGEGPPRHHGPGGHARHRRRELSLRKSILISILAIAFQPLLVAKADAQVQSSLAVGLAVPLGDLEDEWNSGLTFRGQVGFTVTPLEAFLQAGWTRLPATGNPSVWDGRTFDAYHAGIGLRLGLGFFWLGGNAAYFMGDGADGMGYFPEIGIRAWRLEGVVDYRLDGHQKWAAARVGFRF